MVMMLRQISDPRPREYYIQSKNDPFDSVIESCSWSKEVVVACHIEMRCKITLNFYLFRPKNLINSDLNVISQLKGKSLVYHGQ